MNSSGPGIFCWDVLKLLIQSLYFYRYIQISFSSSVSFVVCIFLEISSFNLFYLLANRCLYIPYNVFYFLKIYSVVLSFIVGFSDLSLLFSWSLLWTELCPPSIYALKP